MGVVPMELLFGFCLALVLNRKDVPFTEQFTTVYFLPVVTSMVAVSFVWRWLYEPSFGLINYVLGNLGLPEPRWLMDPSTALISIMITSVWKSMGNSMVIFLAGLRNIPREFYEAAQIDGANRTQMMRFITLPLINSTLVFLTITSVISSFQVFSQVVVMTTQYYEAGGPLDSTRVLVYHIYEVAFKALKMGEAAAAAYVLFAIILLATVLQLKFTQRKVEY
jgi:multiple sugar transport system permease protein